MSQPQASPSIYQLRVILPSISSLIWRRLFVSSDTSPAQLYTILQIVFKKGRFASSWAPYPGVFGHDDHLAVSMPHRF